MSKENSLYSRVCAQGIRCIAKGRRVERKTKSMRCASEQRARWALREGEEERVYSAERGALQLLLAQTTATSPSAPDGGYPSSCKGASPLSGRSIAQTWLTLCAQLVSHTRQRQHSNLNMHILIFDSHHRGKEEVLGNAADLGRVVCTPGPARLQCTSSSSHRSCVALR